VPNPELAFKDTKFLSLLESSSSHRKFLYKVTNKIIQKALLYSLARNIPHTTHMQLEQKVIAVVNKKAKKLMLEDISYYQMRKLMIFNGLLTLFKKSFDKPVILNNVEYDDAILLESLVREKLKDLNKRIEVLGKKRRIYQQKIDELLQEREHLSQTIQQIENKQPTIDFNIKTINFDLLSEDERFIFLKHSKKVALFHKSREKLKKIFLQRSSSVTLEYSDFSKIKNFLESLRDNDFSKKLIKNLIENIQQNKDNLFVDTEDYIFLLNIFLTLIQKNQLGQELEQLIKEVIQNFELDISKNLTKKTSARKIFLEKELSKEDILFLNLMKKLSDGIFITETQKLYLTNRLEESIANSELNEKIHKFFHGNHKSFKEKKELKYIAEDIRYFTYKTKDYKSFDDVLSKLELILELTKDPDLKKESNLFRLNFFELGLLHNLAKLKPMLEHYDEINLLSQSTKLSELYKKSLQADSLLKKFEQLVDIPTHYQSGDILFVHSKKSLVQKHSYADQETMLTHTFISDHGHAAQIYYDEESSQLMLGHIYGSYETSPLKNNNIVSSSIYRLDIKKIITPELSALIGEKGGDQLVDQYQSIVSRIYVENKDRLFDISNDKDERFKAGLANFGLYGGHVAKQPKNFKKYHDMFFKNQPFKRKMICSEFVAKSILAAIQELEIKLKEDLDKKGIKTDGISLLKLPIAMTEDIKRIHPDRLIKVLYESGALLQVQNPSIIDQMLDQQDLSYHAGGEAESIQKLYLTIKSIADHALDRDIFIEKSSFVLRAYIKSYQRKEIQKNDDDSNDFINHALSEFYTKYKSNQIEFFSLFAYIQEMFIFILNKCGLNMKSIHSKEKDTFEELIKSVIKMRKIE
jgi:hypothetical protein